MLSSKVFPRGKDKIAPRTIKKNCANCGEEMLVTIHQITKKYCNDKCQRVKYEKK